MYFMINIAAGSINADAPPAIFLAIYNNNLPETLKKRLAGPSQGEANAAQSPGHRTQ
jgi:hypothetical protein